MSVNKIIKFYDIQPVPSLLMNGLNPSGFTTYSIFKMAFLQEDFYTIEFEKRNLFFDIKEYNSQIMFGTCSTNETIRATSFVQSRNQKTKEAKPFTHLNGEETLEAYTFFYIDFVHNKMAAIANKKVSKIHEALSAFIWEKSDNQAQISILPERIADISKAAKELKSHSWFELDLGLNALDEQIINLNRVLGDDNQIKAKKFRLKVQLEDITNPNIVDRLMGYKKISKKGELSSMKLIGKNELGVDETINFFEALYTKTVPLGLTDDTAINIQYIKNELHNNLNNFLGIST